MADEVALVRDVLRTWGERRSVREWFSPDVTFDMSEEPIPEYPPVLEGWEAYSDFYRTYLENWDQYDVEPLEVVDREEGRVAAVVRERGRSTSGVPFERVISFLYEIRDGKVAAITFFYGRGALEN